MLAKALHTEHYRLLGQVAPRRLDRIDMAGLWRDKDGDDRVDVGVQASLQFCDCLAGVHEGNPHFLLQPPRVQVIHEDTTISQRPVHTDDYQTHPLNEATLVLYGHTIAYLTAFTYPMLKVAP